MFPQRELWTFCPEDAAWSRSLLVMGSVFPGLKAGVMLPLYMLCGQVRKGLTRRNSLFTDMLRTLSVLSWSRGNSSRRPYRTRHCYSQSGKHWGRYCDSIDHSYLILFKLPCQLWIHSGILKPLKTFVFPFALLCFAFYVLFLFYDIQFSVVFF